MRDRLLNAATGLMVLCALLVTSVVVRREFFPGDPAPPRSPAVRNWQEYGAEGHRSGPPSAKITIVTFSDFQCPACRELEQTLRILQARHPETIAVVYRHLPLDSHPFAVPAARASECAAEQERFQEYRNALFEQQDSIGRKKWSQFAEAAGVPDLDAFENCVAREQPIAPLESDMAAARRLQASLTPTVLVNQFRINGALPLPELERFVMEAERTANRTPRSRLSGIRSAIVRSTLLDGQQR